MRWIKAATVFASLLLAAPAVAGFHGGSGSSTPPFNGGSMQVDLYGPQYNEFINVLKPQGGMVCITGGANVNPGQLTSDGYPLSQASTCMASGGMRQKINFPRENELSSQCGSTHCNWAMTWSGNCGLNLTSLPAQSLPLTTQSGSAGTTSAPGSQPWVFTITSAYVPGGEVNFLYTDGTCSNVAMFLVGNCTTLSLGNNCGNYDAYYNCISAGVKLVGSGLNCELFTPQFVNTLKAGKPRSIRTIGWLTSNSIQTSVSTWSSNKPLSYEAWGSNEFNSAFDLTLSNVGDAYSATCSSPCTERPSPASPVDGDFFTVTFTNGPSSASDFTFNLNGSGAIPVGGDGCGAGTLSGFLPPSGGVGTLVYKSNGNGTPGSPSAAWCLPISSSTNLGSAAYGFNNAMPIEVSLQLCKEVQAKCWINVPVYSLDPDTGWTTSLAQLCQTMVVFCEAEGPDEIWNSGLGASNNAYYFSHDQAVRNWSGGHFYDEQSMWMSTINQDFYHVYGSPTKYGIENCLQYGAVDNVVDPPFFNSQEWIAAGTPTFSVSPWVTPLPTYSTASSVNNAPVYVCNAPYVTPAEIGGAYNMADAYNFVTASAANWGTIGSNFILTAEAAAVPYPHLGNSTLAQYETDDALSATQIASWNTIQGSNIGFSRYEGGVQMYAIQNIHSVMMLPGVTAVSSPGANAQLTLGTFDANGVYPSGAAGMPLTLIGFAQSQYNTTASVTGVSGTHNNILTTNLNSTGFSTYAPITVTASAAFSTGAASVSIPSCTGIIAGMSVVDTTSSLAGSPPYGSYFMGQAQGCVTGSPSTLSVGTGTATVTNGTANITWTGNGLGSNAEVMFNANVGSSFTSATPYYVVSTGDTIQLSATPSGSAITVSGLGTSPTTVSIFAQPSVGYTAASAAGTSLASTYASILQGSVGASDTLLIGGGVVVGGTDIQGDNFASAVVSSVITNAKACVFQLASPLRVYPGEGVTTTGGLPSGYNFTNKIVSAFVDSTGEQITIDLDCTALGAITSSPTMTVTQANAANSLFFYSRQTTGMQTVAADDISHFAANGGTGMAQYGYDSGGWNNDGVQPLAPSAWTVFNTPMNYPNSYVPSHAWNAYVSANGGTYTGNTYP